jgi:membrane protease YdiL (CAAX protease family)
MIKIYGINSFKKLFKIRFNDLKIALFLGITAMISIISTYYLTNGIIDYSNVPKSLENSLGISLDNFLFVGLYIAVFNSLLEEMIFRGVLYINLSKGISEKMTIILSSFLFSIYHISIVDGWFNFLSFLLVITLLMLSGIVLNLLDRKTGSILPSWILHIFSNIGINAIGYILLNAK